MDKKIYIRGNAEHPEKVKQVLINHGGRTHYGDSSFSRPDSIYRINDAGVIVEVPPCWITEAITTHPDWEEIFPEPVYKFRVGDMVDWKVSRRRKITALKNAGGKPYYMLDSVTMAAEEELTLCQSEVLTWEDMVKDGSEIAGWFIDDCSEVKKFTEKPELFRDRNIFRTEAQAKSALAMAQISQLIEQPAYGGWVPLGREAWTLCVTKLCDETLTICCNKTVCRSSILRFHTREQAELFLKHNSQLVKDYLMID